MHVIFQAKCSQCPIPSIRTFESIVGVLSVLHIIFHYDSRVDFNFESTDSQSSAGSWYTDDMQSAIGLNNLFDGNEH